MRNSNRLALLVLGAFLMSACDGAAGESAQATSDAPPSPAVPTASSKPATPSPAATATPESTAILSGEAWIVYDGGNRVRFVRHDGTGEHTLTAGLSDTGPQLHARWSNDGEQVAFAADGADGTRDIWVGAVDGSGLRRVLDCAAPCAWADDPSWSPDDTELLVQAGVAAGDASAGLGAGELWAIDVTTGETRVLYTAPPTHYLYVPRWSPDGRTIAVEVDIFNSARLDASTVNAATIGIIDATASTPTFAPLLDWDTFAASPDWSPDGTKLAFHMRPNGGKGTEIFTIEVATGASTQVSDAGATGGQALLATWVQDTGELLFDLEVVRGDNPTLAFVRPDGSGLRLVPPGTGFRGHPMARPLP